MEIMNMNLIHIKNEEKSSILSDVKMTHSTLADSHLMAKGQVGTQGGTMKNAKKFTPSQGLYSERYG